MIVSRCSDSRRRLRRTHTLDHLTFDQFCRALRPRRRLSRTSVAVEGDPYFLTAEQLRQLLGYSSYYFYRKVLALPCEHRLPPKVVCGPDGVVDLRFRVDETYLMYPELDPYRDAATGKTTTWMERWKKKQRAEREAYLASNKSRQVTA